MRKTGVQTALDDVASNICPALRQGGGWYRTATATAGQSWGAACAKCAKVGWYKLRA